MRLPTRYENIYHLLSGSKTFRLFPPVEGYLMDSKPRPFRRDPASNFVSNP